MQEVDLIILVTTVKGTTSCSTEGNDNPLLYFIKKLQRQYKVADDVVLKDGPFSLDAIQYAFVDELIFWNTNGVYNVATTVNYTFYFFSIKKTKIRHFHSRESYCLVLNQFLTKEPF